MRRTIKLCTLILLVALVCALGITGVVASANALQDSIRIVKSTEATAVENNAADTLSRYLSQVCGYTVSVVTDDAAASSNEIAIGNTNRRALDLNEVKANGYVIKSEGGKVYIGGKDGGSLYGAYRFLQEFCGCRWYTSKLKVIPQNAAFVLPTAANIVYNPYFEYTETDWLSPRDAEYSIANGLNGGVYRDLSEAQGGTVDYITGLAHTLATIYCSRGTYFSEHQEWFALHDGVRQGSQLCLTNEAVFEKVRDEVLAKLADSNIYDPTAPLQIVSLTQDDNQLYCECDECRAYEEAHGGAHSAPMINFVNRVADAVAEAGYDNVAIDTFAYQYTRQAPTGIVPRDNVIVRLCTIEGCFCHALDDETCEDNAAIMADLEDWKKICDRIYVWDYTTNYNRTLGIFPDFGVLQANIQMFAENNVLGIYEEGNYYMSRCDSEFGELRAYLLSKLMQNPYCNYYAEMDGFLEAYYGAGWQSIREFIDRITENVSEAEDYHLTIGAKMYETLVFDKDDVAACDALWQTAKEECTNETQLNNIKRSELSWRFWKCGNCVGEFSGLLSLERKNSTKQLYDDLVAFGVTQYKESAMFAQLNKSCYYWPSDIWTDENPIMGLLENYGSEISETLKRGAVVAAIIAVGVIGNAILG